MRECSWGDRIEASAVREALDEDERAHVRECAECRKLTEIVGLLLEQGRAAELAGIEHVPSAQAVLDRASELRARKRERLVLQPIVWVERTAVVLLVVALAGALAWLGGRIDELRADILPAASEASPDLVSVSMLLTAVLVLAAVLYGLAGAFDGDRGRRPR